MNNQNNIEKNKAEKHLNFIRTIIEEDNKTGKFSGRVHTRFPPEPNGYLHIGHAKAICLDFGIAQDYKGMCNLRFDDTNPEKEEEEYVEAIQEDIHWLGFDWEDRLYFASDYFDKMYEYAVKLVKKGKAYVDSSSLEDIRKNRGTVKQPGLESSYRNRSVEENLELLERMKKGEFNDGEHVLRAKIDMSASNMLMRDPLIYRIRHAQHHRSGNKWCIYPMYDFAHCLEDSIEGITHSLCSIEFENNRPLYDWFLDNLEIYHPQQIEFARLHLSYTVLSKRKLLKLVTRGIVSGWDDPRMPTLRGLRRRGYTSSSIRNFCDRIGVAKRYSMVDLALLEHVLRTELNRTTQRRMAVLNPLKVIITNYPQDQVEEHVAINNPEDETAGTRRVPFSRELYIEKDDFQEVPHKKFYRLAPGREVRLRYAYFIRCEKVIKDKQTGEIIALHCTYDPATKGGSAPDGRKVKSTLHWVSVPHACKAEVRIYDKLFIEEDPNTLDNFEEAVNPDSLKILPNCQLEPSLKNAQPEARFQFERKGYFCVDNKDSKPDQPVFNLIVSLKDEWARIQKKR